MACLLVGTWSCYSGASASLSLGAASKTRTSSVSFNMAAAVKTPLRPGFLHCSFAYSFSSLSLSSKSSFSDTSLGLVLDSNFGEKLAKRRGLVVQAKKYRLCQTKRNRSRKSLARTHGFRKRMSTTSGRATLKRRSDKGRWVLCPKTNPSSGKRV